MMPRDSFRRIVVIGISVATLVLGLALPHQHDASTPTHQCQIAQTGADVPRLLAPRPAAPPPSLQQLTPHVERIAAPFVVRLPDSRAPPAFS